MPESLIQLQHAWADHVRDPARPPPPGIDARRLAVYRRLCIDSLDGLLGGSLPRLQHHLGPGRWRALVEAYYAGHVCTTPLFTQIAAEFAQWLGTQQAMTQPAWAAELAHFESSQQALRIEPAEAVAAAPRPLSAEDVLTLSTQVRVLGYRWPVHVCEPGQAPWSASAPATPSLLLMRRLADFELQLEALSPLAYALLMIFGEGACRVDAALQALAVEHALTVAELQPLCASLLDALWARGVLVPAPPRR